MRHTLSGIRGLGAKRIAVLEKNGIYSAEDLVRKQPRKFLDRSKIVKTSQVVANKENTLVLDVVRTRLVHGRKSRLICTMEDSAGELEILYFNGIHHWERMIKRGMRFVVSGYALERGGMIHPDIIRLKDGENYIGEIIPVYSLSEDLKASKIEQKFFRNIVGEALKIENLELPDAMPKVVQSDFELLTFRLHLQRMHQPSKMQDVYKGLRQNKIEELVPVAYRMARRRELLRQKGRARGGSTELINKFLGELPFLLTGAQHRAMEEILQGMRENFQFHALVQGDVGAGKTLVAILSCLAAIESGFQCAVMAPTEILAYQHYKEMEKVLKPFGVSVGLLTGGLKGNARKELQDQLQQGSIQLVIGTHALFSKDVIYSDLGLVIIDEQHKFGVEQRAALIEKGDHPDMLLMSATPIPRSLVRVLYGDLVPVIIDEKPAGRKEIETRLVPPARRGDMIRFLQKEVWKGAQVYWVLPRIDTEEDGLRSVESVEAELRKELPDISIHTVHGRMTDEEKRDALDSFSRGNTSILIATTVVEVGVNVPAATVMVIEGADRFGYAQLHQLRGRVGRGDKESWCFLLSEAEPAYERLRQFSGTSDGFAIAEIDLAERGGGNIEGFEQSGGSAFKFFDFVDDIDMLEEVAAYASELLVEREQRCSDEDLALLQKWLDADKLINDVIA